MFSSEGAREGSGAGASGASGDPMAPLDLSKISFAAMGGSAEAGATTRSLCSAPEGLLGEQVRDGDAASNW